MEIDESVVIIAPIEKVWRRFIDLACWADWNSVLTDISAQRGQIIEGENFRCCVKPYVFPIYFEPKVEEVTPFKRITWVSRKFGITSRHLFSFKQEGGGVQVRSHEVLTGPMMLLPECVMLMPKEKLRALNRTFLKQLKQGAEKP